MVKARTEVANVLTVGLIAMETDFDLSLSDDGIDPERVLVLTRRRRTEWKVVRSFERKGGGVGLWARRDRNLDDLR